MRDRRHLSVLLVDDDQDDYVIVRTILSRVESCTYDLDWVSTYEDALRALEQKAHDVYLVDYRLGAHDGLELLREAGRMGCRAPMIFLTGRGGRDVDEEAMRAGAADYLVKGKIDAPVLERSIRYALERSHTLETLRRSEERFRGIAEASPIPMVITRLSDQRILYVNEYFVSLMGQPEESLVGRTISDFYGCLDNGEALMREMEERGALRNRESGGKKKNGSPFWVNISARNIVLDGEPAMLTGLYDVTELKRAEQELIRLERLRALGEVSAGVSHNLNNILVGILGPAQALQRKIADERSLQMVEDIVTSARRARDLVQRLHGAVRHRQEEGLRPVQVNTVAEETIRAARPRWKDEPESRGVAVKVVADLQEGLPPIRATAAGIHDVLLNLLFNAVDAMPEGGTITVTTRAPGAEVELVVEDTGVGMDEGTLNRVFEPFFTTKVEVGTGLGLYTVYGTVTRFKGRINVQSAPGEGTRFILSFPIDSGAETVAAEGAGEPVERPGKILIVDDDQMVLKVLPYLLSETHEVETVTNGREALELFKPERFDVVLIDLGMPEMPGDRVAKQIREQDPCVATVLITGWELEGTDPRAAGFDFRLQKPFADLKQVRRVVSEAVSLRNTRLKR